MTKDQLIIKNKIEQNWLVIIFLSMWIAGVIFIFITITISTILDFQKISWYFEIVVFLIPFFIIKIKALQILLWNYRGVEQITIDNKYLKIERLGTILYKTKVYDLLDITNIKITDKNPFSWFSSVSLPKNSTV